MIVFIPHILLVHVAPLAVWANQIFGAIDIARDMSAPLPTSLPYSMDGMEVGCS
jgi:hypothetical protein